MSDYTGSNFISQPVQEAINANTVLITTNTTDIGTNTAGLSQEVIDRTNADSNLQTQINNSASAGALNAEIANRIAGDSALQTQVTTNANNLATEISDRQSADNSLQADINTRALQTDLTAETTARTNADTALQTTKANLDGGNTFTGEQDINGYAKIDRVIVQAVSNDYPPFRVTNSFSSFTSAQIDGNKNALLVRSNTTLPGDSIISAYNNSKNDIVFKLGGDGKLTTKAIEADGDVNLTAGKAYKIDNVSIPTNADLALKAPIDNASLTGNTQMTRLTVNHSDATSIGLDFNNTNVNQYAGGFNTAGYGWRFFNDNTSQVANTTFGVFTKGTGSQLNPLLIKNDGKLYTLDQEVNGDVNLTAGKAYKIDNVSIPTNADLALKAPIDNASLTGNTQMTRLTVNHSDATSIGLDFNNTNVNQYAGGFNTAGYGWRFFNDNTSQVANTTFGVFTKGTGSQLNPLLIKNDGKLYTLDQEVNGDVNLTAGKAYKIDNVSIPTNADLAAKRAITNNSFTDLELNGTKQTMTSSGGTINATDYFTEFNLTGQTAELVVDIAETEYIGQTKIVYIQTEGSANLIIRGTYMLSDQDVILRKKGDCVFLQAEWNTSRWKVLGIHSSWQPTLNTTGNLFCGNDIITSRHLFSNSAVVSEISGFSSINLRTPTAGNVPDILIDGVSSFRKKYSPCLIEHRQPSGTNGGSSIQNSWNDITLNEIDLTGRPDYTLSGNQFTVIEPGTYTLSFRASCYATHGTKAEVIGVTNNLKKVQGVSIHTGTQSGGICSGSGEFQTLTANQVFKLRMYTQNAHTNSGLGIAVGIQNEEECFAQVHIQRLF